MHDLAGRADHGHRDWVRAWTIATDALARVSVAAAAATAEQQWPAQAADALAGPFADWAFVDIGDGRPGRAVAARHPDPPLAALLAAVRAGECPLITSAMRRCVPVLAAPADGSALGGLPGGRTVIGVLGASSAAVAPLVSEGTSRGAVTIVRCVGSPGAGFVDLGVLSQIADLIRAAEDLLGRW
jgi:hypothetical protein